jgi:hypothetical protein
LNSSWQRIALSIPPAAPFSRHGMRYGAAP